MKDTGEEKREEDRVSGSKREEKAGGGASMRGSLHPHRRCCNLGHVSHKACWSPGGLAG